MAGFKYLSFMKCLILTIAFSSIFLRKVFNRSLLFSSILPWPRRLSRLVHADSSSGFVWLGWRLSLSRSRASSMAHKGNTPKSAEPRRPMGSRGFPEKKVMSVCSANEKRAADRPFPYMGGLVICIGGVMFMYKGGL